MGQPTLVGYWGRDLRNRTANAACVEFFGRSPEEMQGTHLREVLGPDLYEQSLPHVEAALTGEAQHFHRETRLPSGEVRHTQDSYVPDIVDGEIRGFFVLVADTTESRRAEEEAERARARLAEAEQLAKLGSWEWDIPSERLTCSEGLFAIYGIGPEDFDGRYAGGSERVHPEDRGLVEKVMREAVESGAPVDFEYRIIRPDGRVRRVHSRAELTADAEGRPLRLTGTVQDVTELRASAEARDRTAAGRSDNLAKSLTTRQLEILALVAEGLGNAEIGDRLYLSESTVKWHIRKILRALGVSNRAQAVARYLSGSPRRP
ncbi:MAG TPA: PAS domain-containing protein [Solirubrobacterales bacterium]|nr:PAS domain-containing protein [Solirubrobacterales bacterium]